MVNVHVIMSNRSAMYQAGIKKSNKKGSIELHVHALRLVSDYHTVQNEGSYSVFETSLLPINMYLFNYYYSINGHCYM